MQFKKIPSTPFRLHFRLFRLLRLVIAFTVPLTPPYTLFLNLDNKSHYCQSSTRRLIYHGLPRLSPFFFLACPPPFGYPCLRAAAALTRQLVFVRRSPERESHAVSFVLLSLKSHVGHFGLHTIAEKAPSNVSPHCFWHGVLKEI